ncbi:sel1 repeat family protein [Roseomonas sp. GC11]|uniref:tetratricopeptide repeat protein n=1 Tax=Roseomonas sp. GC11 TaxID=2950546 RepID=UPI00210A6D4A|nr:tetratricopeptide repeat protein [Roseomonas sp. GC11]MCQ4161127.1 sel1 repeat family protein [Roseomonas sp. GC11]
MLFRRRTRRPAAPPPLPLSVVREASAEQLQAAFSGPPEEAARWIAAAARAGMTEGQILYGQILLEGRGVAEDRAAALGWFQVAAQAGDLKGLTMVGRCHEMGWGTPVDLPRAAALYREAAEKGFGWAQYNLATLLARGAGVAEDRAEALRWFRRAAEGGHAKSMTVLGTWMEQGWETPRDVAAAHALYARAAELGDFRAQYNMGSLAAEAGRAEEALSWFRRAAGAGSPGFLGKMARALATRPEPQLRAFGETLLAELIRKAGPAA